MKFTKISQLTAFLLLYASGGIAQNLIVNPGAETDPYASGWTLVAEGTDCNTGNNWHIQGNQNGYPAAREGNYLFFSGCNNVPGEIYQDVDVSTYAAQIDAYLQFFNFSGYTRSRKQTPPDGAQIIVEFRDAANTSVLSAYSTGLTTNINGWQHYSSDNLAPAGTRTIRIRLISYATNGGSVDAFIDDLSLIATILPIKLISFITVATQEGVEAQWITASETNNNYFTLERSKDGLEWEEVVKVPGAGNSTIEIKYNAVDQYPYAGNSYYRLKQTDKDGRISISKINKIKVADNRPALKTYPNPGIDNIYLEGPPEDLKALHFYDINGRNVSKQVQMTPINGSKIRLNISALAPGMYLIRSGNKSLPFYKQ